MKFSSKAENLKLLKKNGVNVPDFELIGFDELLSPDNSINAILDASNNTDIAVLSTALKKAVRQSAKSDHITKLDGDLFAVRSSSNIEDGKSDSFAGQFDTYLNVPRQEINARIVDCLCSLFNENVLSYMKEKNIALKELEMNVVVQKMVPSEISGVMFTANPQGILNEAVITAGRGLGENIVSDKVKTTSYYYNLNDGLYYYEGDEDLLSRETIEELIKTADKLKTFLGDYLDIEFAVCKGEVYFLQTRRITTLCGDAPLVFDNSNIVESYPGLSLPLTISFVKLVYSGVFEGECRRVLKNEKELSKHKDVFHNMVGDANGRIYYKINNWYTLIKFLPFNKKIVAVWQEMLGVKNRSYDPHKVELGFFVRAMTYFNYFYELIRVPGNMKKLNEKFLKIYGEFNNGFTDTLSAEATQKLFNRIKTEILACWDITLINDMYAFLFTGLLKARLKKRYDDHEELTNNYISGITNMESMKPIRALAALAEKKLNAPSDEYRKAFDEYIRQYGDRNLEELKLESRTFRTDPQLLEERVDEYASDPVKLKSIIAELSSKKTVPMPKDPVTAALIKRCTKGIAYREQSRLNRCRIFGMVRSMVLHIGEIFTQRGMIDDKRDIFYLTLDEIRENLETKNDLKKTVDERKKKYEMFAMLPAYSRIVFEKTEFDKNHASINMSKTPSSGDFLRGVPCSSGTAEGEAVVITDVKQAKNVADKILIAKMTDPGWVFLLARAKGIAAQQGSLLSHTAIISRELKIPSVVGVNGLLDSIKTGDTVRLDGTNGTIKILKKGSEK